MLFCSLVVSLCFVPGKRLLCMGRALCGICYLPALFDQERLGADSIEPCPRTIRCINQSSMVISLSGTCYFLSPHLLHDSMSDTASSSAPEAVSASMERLVIGADTPAFDMDNRKTIQSQLKRLRLEDATKNPHSQSEEIRTTPLFSPSAYRTTNKQKLP